MTATERLMYVVTVPLWATSAAWFCAFAAAHYAWQWVSGR